MQHENQYIINIQKVRPSGNLYQLVVGGNVFVEGIAETREDAREVKRQLEASGHKDIKILKYDRSGYVR